MRNFTITALTLAAALSGTAVLAQSVNPGVAQLAALAGVSPDGFSQAQLIRLIDAQRDNDKEEIAFILSQRASTVSRSDMGGVSVGAAQFAAIEGVAPGALSVNELQLLEQAKRENNRERIDFILSGGVNTETGVAATNPGAIQLAASLGVNAADYTLAELTKMYADKVSND